MSKLIFITNGILVQQNETGLVDITPSQPDSRKLTQSPAEYMDLIEVNKDDREAQRTAPGADYVNNA